MNQIKATTIFAIKRDGKAAISGDGQVTFGERIIMKQSAKKIRRLYKGQVLAGFAGSVADAITLSEKFETKLEEYHGHLPRAAVEMAKEWRADKILRKLEAMLIVLNAEHLLLIAGSGEVIEPDDDVLAIGSGGSYALAAGRALARHATQLTCGELAKEALKIASELCVFTNDNIIVEEI
ncbi:MAG: hypothetical protein RLZ12_296 [Bacillota bacterium]